MNAILFSQSGQCGELSMANKILHFDSVMGEGTVVKITAALAEPITNKGALLKTDNIIIMRSSFTKRRYVAEFHEDKFIYRIQDKNCFLEFRHGCLIPGFGWHDQYSYTFKRSAGQK